MHTAGLIENTGSSARRGTRAEVVLPSVVRRELSDESCSATRASSESVENPSTSRLPAPVDQHRISQYIFSWVRHVLSTTMIVSE